jgi:Holliday junction resolvase
VRRAARVDDNHKEISAALRKIGCSVLSLASIGSGCPDLLVGWRGRNMLLEVKDGSKSPSRRELTEDERRFMVEWNGSALVVYTVDDALSVVRLHCNAL